MKKPSEAFGDGWEACLQALRVRYGFKIPDEMFDGFLSFLMNLYARSYDGEADSGDHAAP